VNLKIEVELFGQLAADKEKKQTLEVDEGCTAGEVAEKLKLDPRLVGLVTIDGVQQNLNARLSPVCRLCFFPPMSGG
jgi:molybdopterin converting factor small subunit